MVEDALNFRKEFEKLTSDQKKYFVQLTYYLLKDIDQVKKLEFALGKAKDYKPKEIERLLFEKD